MKKRYFFLSILCSILSAGIILLAAWLPSRYQVPVLMYHAVSPSWHEPLNNVSPASFEKQMAYLKKQGYRVLTLDELVDRLRAGREGDQKSVVITFDDGYENNYTFAYPVLKRYGFPATIFVEVERLGMPGRLSWAQAREMDSGGVLIESHLMKGAYLPDLSHHERVAEIVESRKVLEERLGRSVAYLAYPIGGFDEDVKNIARHAGYKAAFATNRGYDREGKDLFEIKRIRIKDSDSGHRLWLKLSGYYNLLRRSKNPF